MKYFEGERLKRLRGLLATGQPEPAQQAERIVRMLRDVVSPSKAGLSLVVLYYLFYSGWLYEEQTALLAMDMLRKFFLVYLLCNFVGWGMLLSWRRLPPALIQWLAFMLGLLDGLFIAGMTSATGGFSSIVFWVFPGLIVLNALCIPLAMPQIVLNLLLSIFYTGAVLLTPHIGWESSLPDRQVLANMYASTNTMHFNRLGLTNGLPHQILLPGRALVPPPGSRSTNILANLNEFVGKNHGEENNPADDIVDEQLVLRVAVLWLLTLCCYGTQLLLERQRQATLEAAEFATREGQLHAAGRLAAEFAHQIKNPLAIINNAAFSLQRTLRDPKNSAALQIEIIQEEVARADKVITQIMGYAQLSEGRVEKLRVVEEIERACEQVLPGAMTEGIQLRKKLTGPFPPLLMQRGHLSEILLNLLLNAREALAGHGTIQIAVSCNPDQDVVISVADDGPGIPPDQVGRIFEAYFTTKEKGTGLGLAIVKHNAELYGGRIAVDSVLGNGAKFTVTLPAKSKPQPFPK